MDRYLSAAIRGQIEERYYARVNEQSRLEALRQDPLFLHQEDDHVGLYSDHGIVHVRDVAQQVVAVLQVANGILIPERTPAQLSWMQGYGVLVAYLHDIGMRDFSPFGRTMHPEFAAQAVFSAELDDVIEAIWRENSGNVPWRILQLASGDHFSAPPETILRELLSLSLAHSKSKVPTSILNNPALLRGAVIEALVSDLQYLYQKEQVQQARQRLDRAGAKAKAALEATLQAAEQRLAETSQQPAAQENLAPQRFYRDIGSEALSWLISAAPELVALTEDVTDTLRALRCADGLRQRGTVLKTSGGYEVFVNHTTANAVYALRDGDERLFLLETESTFSAGEANVASSELDREGNLRISFGRGNFATEAASAHAVRCAAAVVADIALDVLSSFDRWADEPPLQTRRTRLLLEETDDDLRFAERVREAVQQLAPSLEHRVEVVPSLERAPRLEQERYLAAQAIDWDVATRRAFLEKLGQYGHPVTNMDAEGAFMHTRLARLARGEALLEAGQPAAFVYVPLDRGLEIKPLGGYRSFSVQAWMPLGATGVIRGAPRNGTVLANKETLVLIIPKSVFLHYWHRTHSTKSLRGVFKKAMGPADREQPEVATLEHMLILAQMPLFQQLDQRALKILAQRCRTVSLTAGDALFEQGEPGDGAYIIIDGKIDIVRNGQIIARRGKGALIGEMAVLASGYRSASVVAAAATQLLHIERETFTNVLNDHPEMTRSLVELLAKRLEATSLELAERQRSTLSDAEEQPGATTV